MLVQKLNGSPVFLDTNASRTTIRGLKLAIAQHPLLGVPELSQHLLFAGRSLAGPNESGQEGKEQILATLGIEDDSIIHLCTFVTRLSVRWS